MAQFVERRKYRRFEIPGGKVNIARFRGYSFFKPFSAHYPLLNICMGGLNILSTREFSTGEDLLLELHAPDEKVIRLRSKVIWTNPIAISKDTLIGFEFFPFGEDKHLNPHEAMHVLRRLYARYIET